MFSLNNINLHGNALKRALLPWALPRITELKPADWEDALIRARATNFDLTERIGLLIVVALVTYLLRFDVLQMADVPLPILLMAQFFAALPLLVLLAGPFYLRCLRRGLDHEIERRHIAG